MSLELEIQRQTDFFTKLVRSSIDHEGMDPDFRRIALDFLSYKDRDKIYVYPHEEVFGVFCFRRETIGAIVFIPIDFSEHVGVDMVARKSFLKALFEAVYFSQEPEERDWEFINRMKAKIQNFEEQR